jgi:hypothetical protein
MIDNRGYVFGPPSEDDGIAAVAGSFSGLHMDRDVEGITRRARALSRRRRAVPAVAAAAIVAAAGTVAVVGSAHSPAPATAVAGPGAPSAVGNLTLTGFTVKSDPSNGIITVTVKNFSDPSGLVSALARYGVRVQLQYMTIPSVKAVERSAKMMGTSGDTYYFGPGWTRQPNGTYLIQINLKVLGPHPVQPIVVVRGTSPAAK